MKFAKAVLLWLLIVPLAIVNGGLRNYITEPLVGSSIALPLSGIILSVLVFVMAFCFIPKIGQCATGEYIAIGLIWFILTNLFDLVVTIFETGKVSDFLKMYDITSGNLWSVVVVVCAVSPILVAKIRKLI